MLYFTLSVGQTFADVATLENANVAVSVTLGRRLPYFDFTAAWTTTATARTYEHVLTPRNDLQIQTGPKFTYSPTPNIQTSLQVSYFQNYSTVSSVRWNGYVIQPTIIIAFAPSDFSPPTKKRH